MFAIKYPDLNFKNIIKLIFQMWKNYTFAPPWYYTIIIARKMSFKDVEKSWFQTKSDIF